MSSFGMYFELGVMHILDLEGIDHLVFILAIAAPYRFIDWKKLIILVSAFTVGHSVTLALSAFDIVRINENLVETLIPVTLLITALVNLGKTGQKLNMKLVYLLIFFFGLIHGLGFSNFFNALMSESSEVTSALFAFNLGIEVAQIMIVLIILIITELFNFFKPKSQKMRIIFLNGGVFFLALQMLFEALFTT